MRISDWSSDVCSSDLWSFWSAMMAGALASALVAMILGGPILKLKSHYFMFATFVIAEICQQLAMNWDPVTHGATGIAAVPRPSFLEIPIDNNIKFYYFVLSFIIIAIYISFRVEIGRASCG